MKVKLTILLLACAVSFFSKAQTSPQTKLLPMLAPPSPEVAGLGRYGTYEVNLFTGVPDISIPLYDIQIGELRLPISIKYHASGIKLSEMPSRIGLGWSLDAGGTITRKIQSKPDEQPGNYFAATPTSDFRVKDISEIDGYTEASLDYLSRMDVRQYDGEPDIFSYNFPGHSGRFIFNQKDNFNPFLIPYAPVSVSKIFINPTMIYFSLKDESGRTYAYSNIETTTSGSGVGLLANTCSAWLLSKIYSANMQDSIQLKYSDEGISDQYENEYFIINDNVSNISGDGYYTNDFGAFSGEIVNTSTVAQRLDTIIFRNGKVVFEPGTDARRTNFIRVYSFDPASKAYTLIKIVQFFHSFFDASRLRLDSVQIQTSTSQAIQTYKFNYNASISLPSRMTKMKDYWGYYNARSNTIPNTSTPTSIPKINHTYVQPPGAPYDIWIGGNNINARDPDPSYMQAYILQKITFPTGGYTQFEYETNQYLDDNGSPQYAGGLRIKSVKTYTGASATPIVKTYKYGQNESGFGRANFFLEQSFFGNHQPCRWVEIGLNQIGQCRGNSSKVMHTYFANPTNDLEGSDGSPVVYSVVTEYDGDGTTNNGKTVYQFTDKPDAKTSIIGYGKPFFDSYQFIRGLLTNKSVFKNDGEGYTVVREERKGYQFFPYQWSTGGVGLVVKKLQLDQGNNGTMNNIGTNGGTACQTFSDAFNYNYNLYNIVSGDNKLVADTAITYDQNDPTKSLSTITAYTYDDLTHLGLSQTQTTNSKNEALKSVYNYPYNSAISPYPSMTAAHIWDKVVTDTKFNGPTQLTQQTNNFSSFSGNNYLPANIQFKVKTNAVETRATINQYDVRGNVLEMQKTNDVKQSFIWDYNSTQLIAEVAGAGQSDAAYTSFEADGKGNWTFTGFASLDPTTPTGYKCYTLGSSITKSGLSTSTTYIVSYWKKSGTVAVNATSPTAGRTVNGWTYYEHKVVNPAGGLITVSGTNGIIDELRLYPATSVQMTTYAYTPLVGINSKCDANNRTTYYEYDRFNRLMLIRDQDKNILKQFCYNYSGQPENCNINYNQTQSGVFYKSGCTGCLTGSAVTYTVPANMYSAPTVSEANQLAINDVIANGPAYADANGTCVTPSNVNVSGSNGNNQTHTFYFHNNCTSTNYNFSMGPNASLSVLGTVPAGNYNVTFNPPAGSGQYTYRIGSLTLRANSGTISNVTVGTGGVVVNITP
jgi:hypothetical protein